MKANEKRIRVTDIIPAEDIKHWNPEQLIIIEAGTGTGKSYFVKNTLYNEARRKKTKILFLIHRSNCINAFMAEIERDKKTDTIELKSYQKLEHSDIYKYYDDWDYLDYEFIVADEFHYFIGDSLYNHMTDLSLEIIMSQQDAVRIFMSATGEDVEHYLRAQYGDRYEIKKYSLPRDYDCIEKLTFYNSDNDLETLAEKFIKSGQKAIFFIQKAEKAYKLFKQFEKNALFNCSKYNRAYHNYVDETKINSMLANEKFEEQLLITTACLDAGANIIDKDIRHIVVDVTDFGSLVQCVGRKRIIDKSDTFELYIKNISNQRISGLLTKAKKDIEMSDFLLKYGSKKLVEKYPRQYDKSYIIYDKPSGNDSVVKKVNTLMYTKKKSDIEWYNQLLYEEECGYCSYVAAHFNKPTFKMLYNDYSLRAYLDKYVNEHIIMYQTRDRKPLIEKLNVRGGNRKLLKSIDSLNGYLTEIGMPYNIISYETSKIINGKKKKFKQAWKVIKI